MRGSPLRGLLFRYPYFFSRHVSTALHHVEWSSENTCVFHNGCSWENRFIDFITDRSDLPFHSLTGSKQWPCGDQAIFPKSVSFFCYILKIITTIILSFSIFLHCISRVSRYDVTQSITWDTLFGESWVYRIAYWKHHNFEPLTFNSNIFKGINESTKSANILVEI